MNTNMNIYYYTPEIVFSIITLTTLFYTKIRYKNKQKITFNDNITVQKIYRRDIIYIDFRDVIIDTNSCIKNLNMDEHKLFNELEHTDKFILKMDEIGSVKKSIEYLSNCHDVYLVSSIENLDIIKWISLHLGAEWLRKLIMFKNKNLLKGDYFITKDLSDGVDFFNGEKILFGTKKFPDWETIIKYFNTNSNWCPI